MLLPDHIIPAAPQFNIELLEKDKLIIPGRIKRDSSFEANMHHLKLNGIRHNMLLRERGGIMFSLYNHISFMRWYLKLHDPTDAKTILHFLSETYAKNVLERETGH